MSKFVLNEIFEQKAKVYQSRPVRAMIYEKGMETGFVVYYANKPNKKENIGLCEGMKFFDTESEAWDYINSNPDQHINVDGKLMKVDVVYDAPLPILHRKVNNPDERVGYIGSHEGQYAFVSNESERYDFFYLDCNTCDKPIWIIQDMDGSVRVWDVDYPDLCGETFFGKADELIYEKAAENEYVPVKM